MGDAGPDGLGASLRYHRTVGPVVAEVGVSGFAALPFGGTILDEVHVAVGRSASVGPLFATATAGPSLGRAFSPVRGETVPVAGVFAALEAELVIVRFLGLGAEAFAHLNTVNPVAGFGVVYAFGRLPGALIPDPPPTPRRPGP